MFLELLQIGKTCPEYLLFAHAAGVPASDNPSATGQETSATWESAAVVSIKANREFILGGATITVNFRDTNVDLMFDDWRGLDNQAVSGMSAISYEDLTLTEGSFTSDKSNEKFMEVFKEQAIRKSAGSSIPRWSRVLLERQGKQGNNSLTNMNPFIDTPRSVGRCLIKRENGWR